MQFMNYGTVVSVPKPGDMVVQAGHVGIYVGNDQVGTNSRPRTGKQSRAACRECRPPPNGERLLTGRKHYARS
jgi:hypothetical protein